VDARITVDKLDKVFRVLGTTHHEAIRKVRDAVDDIADEIEAEARIQAPEGDTGALKAHPIERDDARIGIADVRNPLFGGGFAFRGPSGFIPGVGQPGEVIAQINISLPTKPAHAVWVHEGTGIYGPHNSPIVPRTHPYLVFHIDGRKFVRKSVRGQPPQPYLLEAYLVVNRTFVPARIARLRASV